MPSRKIGDAVVKVGTYQDASGQQKSRYENVGAFFRGDDDSIFMTIKPWVNLAALPRPEGRDTVTIGCFAPREERSAVPPPARNAATTNGNARASAASTTADDDVPF